VSLGTTARLSIAAALSLALLQIALLQIALAPING
jgi:hypothetical protein